MAFEPGDVVTLKSGGHSMTVVSVDDEDIDCLWIGDDGQMYRQSVPAIALTAAESLDFGEMHKAGDGEEADDEEDEEDKDDEEDDGDDEDDDDDDDEEDEDDDDEEDEENVRRVKRR